MVKDMDLNSNHNNGLGPHSRGSQSGPSSSASDFIVVSRPGSNGRGSDVGSGIVSQSLQLIDSLASELSLDQAIDRVRSLMRENIDLRDNLQQSNDTMKRQYDQIRDWKLKYDQSKEDIKKKYELTKRVVTKLKQDAEEAKNKIKMLEEEMGSNQDKAPELQKEILRLQKVVKELSETKEFLVQSKVILEKQVDDLSVEVWDMRRKIETGSKHSIEEVVVQSSPEYMNAKKQLVQVQQELETGQSQLQEIILELQNEKDSKNELVDRISQLESEMSSIVTERNQLQHDLSRGKVEATSLRSKLQKTKEINERLILEKNDLIGMNNQLNVEVTDLKSPTRSLKETASPVQVNYSELENTAVEREELQKHSAEGSEERGHGSGSQRDVSVIDLLTQLKMERDALSTKQQEVSALKQDMKMAENNTIQFQQQIHALNLELDQARKQPPTPDLETESHQLKAQVMSLVKENNVLQQKTRNQEAELIREQDRCRELQAQMEQERGKDDALIDSMRIVIGKLESQVEVHAAEKETLRLSYNDLRVNFDQLCKDYHELLDEFEEYRKEMERRNANIAAESSEAAKLREKIDNLTARLMSVEEIVKGKEEERKQLMQELMRVRHRCSVLQNDVEAIPILKATMEGYKADFNEERSARERMHGDNERLKSDITDLQLTNQQLQDEVQSLSRKEMANMMQRHGTFGRPAYSNYPPIRPPVTYGYGQRPTSPLYGMPAAARQFSDEEHEVHRDPGSDRSSEVNEPLLCPKCNMECPDIDTLQIHASECID